MLLITLFKNFVQSVAFFAETIALTYYLYAIYLLSLYNLSTIYYTTLVYCLKGV